MKQSSLRFFGHLFFAVSVVIVKLCAVCKVYAVSCIVVWRCYLIGGRKWHISPWYYRTVWYALASWNNEKKNQKSLYFEAPLYALRKARCRHIWDASTPIALRLQFGYNAWTHQTARKESIICHFHWCCDIASSETALDRCFVKRSHRLDISSGGSFQVELLNKRSTRGAFGNWPLMVVGRLLLLGSPGGDSACARETWAVSTIGDAPPSCCMTVAPPLSTITPGCRKLGGHCPCYKVIAQTNTVPCHTGTLPSGLTRFTTRRRSCVQ